MAASSSSSSPAPLGILQILWEALQLPAKSGFLFLALLLLTLLSSSLLFLSAYSISPLVLDLVSKLSPLFNNPLAPSPPNLFHDIKKDLHDIAGLASAVSLVFFSVSLFLMVATLYTFAMAYSDNTLSPRQLLLSISRRWYQTLVTSLYVLLLALGLALLSALVIGTLLLASSPASDQLAATASSAFSLAIVPVLLYLYLSTRWAMSLVIAVVEETWGIGALSWSVELFIGNKKRGTLLTLVLKMLQLLIYGAFCVAISSPPGRPPQPPESQTRFWFMAAAAATALWDLYAMAVYTVFYYECRKSHGLDEVVAAVEAGGYIYTNLPPAAAVGKPIF